MTRHAWPIACWSAVVALSGAAVACDASSGPSAPSHDTLARLAFESGDAGAETAEAAAGDVPLGDDGEGEGPDVDLGDAHNGPCDPVAQTGCGDDGTCTYLALSASEPVCAPRGSVGYGEACSAEEPCAHGICLALNQAVALCYRFCAPPEPDSSGVGDGDTGCADGAACLALDNATYRICEIAGVYATCNLLAPVQCPSSQGCYRIASEPQPVCLPAGAAQEAEPCTAANGCAAGLACVDGACAPLCELGAASPCVADGATCKPYFEADVGYCR